MGRDTQPDSRSCPIVVTSGLLATSTTLDGGNVQRHAGRVRVQGVCVEVVGPTED